MAEEEIEEFRALFAAMDDDDSGFLDMRPGANLPGGLFGVSMETKWKTCFFIFFAGPLEIDTQFLLSQRPFLWGEQLAEVNKKAIGEPAIQTCHHLPR